MQITTQTSHLPRPVHHMALMLMCAIISLWLISTPSMAASTVLQFESAEQEALYLTLTKEFRCLKCQNQNLADSNAELAKDLRNEIYVQVSDGQSRGAITAYLVARYGDFVLYRPPFKRSTYLLWLGPFLLLGVALWLALRFSRRVHLNRVDPDRDQLAQARQILDEKSDSSTHPR